MSRQALLVSITEAVAAAGTFDVNYLEGQEEADFTAGQTVSIEVYGRTFSGLVCELGASAATITWPADAPYDLPVGEYYVELDLVGTDTPGEATFVADLTDSTGGTATITLGAIAAVTALTDSTGGTATITLGAIAAVTALTDSTGGVAAESLVDVTGAHDQAILNANFASLAAKVNALQANNAVLRDAVASLAAKVNALQANNTVVRDAVASLAAQDARVTAALIDAGLMAGE